MLMCNQQTPSNKATKTIQYSKPLNTYPLSVLSHVCNIKFHHQSYHYLFGDANAHLGYLDQHEINHYG